MPPDKSEPFGAATATSSLERVEGARRTLPMRKPPIRVEQAYFLSTEERKSLFKRFHDMEYGIVRLSKMDGLKYGPIESALRTERREELRKARVLAFVPRGKAA